MLSSTTAPKHPSGKAWSTGDNRTGAGDGDDEQLIFKLDTLDARFEKIVFVVSIYRGRQKNQHFGLVDNAFIRAIDTCERKLPASTCRAMPPSMVCVPWYLLKYTAKTALEIPRPRYTSPGRLLRGDLKTICERITFKILL